MRARLAILVSRQQCELREVVLRDKPAEMLALSPKATVPVLVRNDGTILDESLEIMQWALHKNDPGNWLEPQIGDGEEMLDLIGRIDGPFKRHLDRYKYATRYRDENDGAGVDRQEHRAAAMEILNEFEDRLKKHKHLFGERVALADMATAPFVRQFANTDKDWFASQPYPKLQHWLNRFLRSEHFLASMQKYDRWTNAKPGVPFPG